MAATHEEPLCGLPSEVWIAHIPPYFNAKEMTLLGLISKKFYSLTSEPSLWRDFQFEFDINKRVSTLSSKEVPLKESKCLT